MRKVLSPFTRSATGAKASFYALLIAATASAFAGASNNWIMRTKEVESGIEVLDPNTMQPVGISKEAAKTARFQTASSRLVMSGTMLITGFLQLGLDKLRLMPKNKHAVMGIQTALTALQLIVAVPLSVGMFP